MKPTAPTNDDGSDALRMLELMPFGVVRVTNDVITFVNAAFVSLMKATPAQLLGKKVAELVAAQDVEMVLQRRAARQAGELVPQAYETSALRPDGTTVRVEIEPRVISPGVTLVLVRDRQGALHERELLLALSDLSSRLESTEGVNALLRGTQEGLTALGFSSMVLRVDGDHVVLGEGAGHLLAREAVEHTMAGRMAGRRVPLAATKRIAEVLQLGHSVYDDDFRGSFIRFAASMGKTETREEIRSAEHLAQGVYSPLMVRGKAWGLLWVSSTSLSAQDAAILGLFATQLASGIEVALTIEDLERRNTELQAIHAVADAGSETELEHVLPRVLAIAALATDSERCAVFLTESARRELLLVGAHGFPPGMTDRVRRLPLDAPGDALLAPDHGRSFPTSALPEPRRSELDAAGFGENLLLPLQIKGRQAGTLWLSREAGRTYGETEIQSAERLAAQIAIQVEGARLHSETRRLLADLEASYAELARTQGELIKRERLAALGELAALVAHEVRNPLGVIFNSLGSLQRILNLEGDARMLLDIVGEEADRLNRIVGDLLDFARPREPLLQPELLPALVEDVIVAAVPAGSHITVRRDVPADLPAVPIDARMMRQALLNLLLNAVQAMPRGGTLVVGARVGKGELRIEVADSGSGIAPEFAARIFEPFFTTKATGTGLGLAVVKRIAESHHGRIAVEAVPDGGTRFVLTLPIPEAT